MKEKSQSKLATKTRGWITDALISLMQEKSFKSITITEIVERADVSRQSFYRHYDTKRDILDEYLYERSVVKFKEEFENEDINTVYDVLLFYFKFWHNHNDTLELIIESDYILQIFEEYDETMRTHYNETLKIIFDELNITDSAELEIVKSFIIGGLYNVKIHWTRDGYDKSPENMAKAVEKLLIKS